IRSHISLPIFKGRKATGKDKTKKLVENVFTTYLEDRREQRETTYIYRTSIHSLYEDTTIQCPTALPPIQLFLESAVEDNECEILFMESIQQFSTVYPEAHVWLLKK
ncbi:unnamed protein product, partial [Porites evermanni]